MEKKSARFTILGFLSSMSQLLIFGILFILYSILIPWSFNLLFVPYIVIPILSAYMLCRIINRKRFSFGSYKTNPKASACRLTGRFLAAAGFVTFGYIIEKTSYDPYVFFHDILKIHGEFGSIVTLVLSRMIYYVLVSIFAIVFALVEYLFVPTEK